MTALVIKVGGSVMADAANLEQFITDLVALSAVHNCVLVHGGGDITQEWLTQLGFVSEKVDGVRVTPAEHLPFVVGALSGWVNTHLTALVNAKGCKALGMTLVDGGITKAKPAAQKYGAVATAEPASPGLIKLLLASDYLPVVSSISADKAGALFNVNADDAASSIAELLNAKLVLLTDVQGVLDHSQQVISEIDEHQFEQLCHDDIIQGGMVIKIKSALELSAKTGQEVVIQSWQNISNLTNIDAKDSRCGTIVMSHGISQADTLSQVKEQM